jgi:hypothetical protein
LPEHELPLYAEGNVTNLVRDHEGSSSSAEVQFYTKAGSYTVNVPLDQIELVISTSTLDRTAVFWGLEESPERLVEAAMHSMLDSGFQLREGLNTACLSYEHRWWKWGEKTSNATGAQMVASAGAWDGGIVAFSGLQRFHLEFRLRGRSPVIFLHEREAAYAQQMSTTHAAMSLSRVLANLAGAVGAQFCAFPVATAWLLDEDWRSLLCPPLYPDFFLLPEAQLPQPVPESFRTIKLVGQRALLTVLPVKSYPSEAGIERGERELKLDHLRKCKALGEKYYDQMYESPFSPSGLYSSAKDAFHDAIAAANSLGLTQEAAELEKRLAHIKAVFRSQFS